MITTITEKETQLAHMLTVCSEALKAVTAERDELRVELAAERTESAAQHLAIMRTAVKEAINAALERAAVVCATEWATTEERKHGRALAAEIRAMKEEV